MMRRYEPKPWDIRRCDMIHADEGEYVLYCDAQTEIERLTKERDEATIKAECWETTARKMEDYRDDALAQVAAAYEAAASIVVTGEPEISPITRHAITALTTAHAQAALEAYGREKVREGMRLAAGLIAKRRDDYISEYGIYDPTTGVTEFPGNGDEYVYELDDCEAVILAEMEKLK